MRRRKRRRFSFYLSVPEGLVARSGFIAMTGSLLEPGLPRLSVPSADVGPANIADKSASKFDAALDSVIVRSFSLLLSSSLFSLLSSSSLLFFSLLFLYRVYEPPLSRGTLKKEKVMGQKVKERGDDQTKSLLLSSSLLCAVQFQ